MTSHAIDPNGAVADTPNPIQETSYDHAVAQSLRSWEPLNVSATKCISTSGDVKSDRWLGAKHYGNATAAPRRDTEQEPSSVDLPSRIGVCTHGGLRLNGTGRPRTEGKPCLTIITAVFNAEDELERTISSVLSQTYDSIEYIVIDGASSDGTVELLRRYSHALDYWISEPDKGISDAWNKGIALSSGDFVAFLNAGDEYFPGALEEVAKRVCGYDFSWGDMEWIDESGYPSFFKGRDTFDQVIRYIMPFNHPTMFFARPALSRVGMYSTELRYAMDYDLVRRIATSSDRGVYVPYTISRMKAGGVHDKNYSETLAEVRWVARKYGASRVATWLAQQYTARMHKGGGDPIGRALGHAVAAWKGMRP